MSTKSIFASLTVVAALAGAGAAFAAPSANQFPDADAVSTKVYFADLNLSREKDAKELLVRINRAAKLVCGGAVSIDLRLGRTYQTCITHASVSAVAGINNPMVTAMFDGAQPIQVAGKN